MHLQRVILGFSSALHACGQEFCFYRRVGAGHADHVCCSVQQRNCLVFLEVSPVLHNCSSEVTKAKALPADSTLQSCGNNCWIKQRGKKLPVGPQSKLEFHERKNRIQKNLTEKQWEKTLLIYREQKPESSRSSPSCFHIQSIFSLAHMEWASANFLLQTFLFLTILRKKQGS